MPKLLLRSVSIVLFALGIARAAAQRTPTTLTIATVNNGDMVLMQRLASEFERAHPEIHIDWVMLEENILREKTTTDAATHGGQYDVVTIGPLEAPVWGRRGWLLPLQDKLSPSYDLNDLLKPIRDGASDHGKLFATARTSSPLPGCVCRRNPHTERSSSSQRL